MNSRHAGKIAFWISVILWVAVVLRICGLVSWSPAFGYLLSCAAAVALLGSIAGLLLDKSRSYAIAALGMSGLFLLLCRHF